ncbi:HlyD family secretion protein [Fulvivirgaceae bacterium BMA12]|uniref:HlyD family secretion protein n=1 Tax=Agaribacillus aureus TaxID=3051825 RepID=A0ABT8L5L6_9BACT|nr:HlyD family secretion protein [Fulvivirgaceae bacterium BMA12]
MQNEGINGPEGQKKKIHKIINFSILILLILACGVYGINWFNHQRQYESTDNAQLEGHIYLVNPRVGGQVDQVLIDDNQQVRKGDVLVMLDKSDFEVMYAQANAGLLQAKAELASVAANAQAVKAKVDAAYAGIALVRAQQAQVNTDMNRLTSLRRDDVVPQSQLDNIVTSSKVTRAQLDAAIQQHKAAESQYTAAKSKYQSVQAAVEAAQIQVQNAALKLSYATIRAPYDGIISRKNVEEGQVVRPGQPLMAVTDYAKIWVVANFKEVQIGTIEKGQMVQIGVDAYPGMVLEGKVSSIAAATGAKFALLPPDNATGNFTKVTQRVPVKIELSPRNADQPTLRPGMNVTVKVRVSSTAR